MECYLDNAATTQAYEDVCELVAKVMREDYGNPSSLHMKGVEGEKYVREAADRIAKTLKCQRKNIVFSSGGTESNNTALIGTALANKRRGRRILTTCFEHASVHEPLIYLESMGFQVEYLPVDEQGHLKTETLKEALTEDTILVSVMMVNNEIGSVLDVQELAKVVKDFDPQIIFHVDAIQAYGKMKIQPAKWQIDLMSVSGHKIHGPKGTGFLYVRNGLELPAYIDGGSQENGRRAGTSNVPGIVGLGKACEIAARNMSRNINNMTRLRNRIIYKIKKGLPDAVLTGSEQMRLPNNISFCFPHVESSQLLAILDTHGICASAGSACSTGAAGPSHVLIAMGINPELAGGSLRLTISDETTIEEADYVADTVIKTVKKLTI